MEWHGGGNIYIRAGVIKKRGQKIKGHKHNFDHVTIVRRGRMAIRSLKDDGTVEREVIKDDKSLNYGHILIKAGVCHELEALEDDTVYWCIYAHRDPITGEVIPTYEGWMEAYG
jgi:quercetin dioxygenase-like cupin family protein